MSSLLTKRLRDVGVFRRSELEGASGDGSGTRVAVVCHHAIALRQERFGAVDGEIRLKPDGELLEEPAQTARAWREDETMLVLFAEGLDPVEVGDVLQIQPGGERRNGVVEEGTLPELVELGFFEVRLVDPHLLAVAHGGARIVCL